MKRNVGDIRGDIRDLPAWVRTTTTESKSGWSVHILTGTHGWTGRGETELLALYDAYARTPLPVHEARRKAVTA